MYKMELILFKGSETHQFTGGANLISAVLVLAPMILPTVINISESALRSVPAHLKSASLALGATKIQTIFQVIVPAAKSGIITAVVLGTGRAIGEAMAISLVSGSSVNLPLPFSSVRFLTTAIVSEMGYASGLHRQVLFTIGLVLFAFIMIINISLTRILKRGETGMTNDIAVRVHKDSVVQDSIYGRRVRGLDVFLTVIIYTCAGFSILLLAGIMGYVFVRGIPHVTWAFLSTASSATKGTFGILGNIINTLYIVIITLLIATPLGIGSAVYLNEYAKPGKVVRLIEFTTETLSGIPSIIFGLFGMVFLEMLWDWDILS